MKTSEALVSILIPCYNAAPYLRQCIESALNQTYKFIEIILLDDGSTDESLTIAQSYPIRVECQRHQGAAATRNRLLEMSAGEWIQYLDADDYLTVGKIDFQLLQSNAFKLPNYKDTSPFFRQKSLETEGLNKAPDIYICAYKLIKNEVDDYPIYFPSENILKHLASGHGPQINSLLIKRVTLKKVELNTGLQVGQKIWQERPYSDLWLLLDCIVKAQAKVQVSQHVGCCYRQGWSTQQISSQHKNARVRALEALKSAAKASINS